MWRSYKSDERNTRDKSDPNSIAPHLTNSIKFPRYISPDPLIAPREQDAEQVLFTIIDVEILRYWSRNTRHYSSHSHNEKDEISEEGLEVYSGE